MSSLNQSLRRIESKLRRSIVRRGAFSRRLLFSVLLIMFYGILPSIL